MLQNEGHFNALSLAQGPLQLLIADRELSLVIETGYTAPEQLPDADWQRFALYQVMAFNAWEYLYYAHQSNSIPENLWTGADAYYRQLSNTKPGIRRFWGEYDHIFDEPFHDYAENIIRARPVPPANDIQKADSRAAVQKTPTAAQQRDTAGTSRDW
jgi:hypothetical protein